MTMSWKKIAVSVCAGVFALTTVAAVPSVAMAAKGGARISAPRVSAPAAAPKVSAPAAKAAAPNQKEYKPSQNASSIKEQAPAARTGAAPAARSASSWGGIMRNVGLFAGGMLLGGMLSHLFGFGMGSFMSDVMGLLMNLVIFGAVFMLIRMAIRKFTGRKKEEQDPYHAREASAMRQEEPINVTPRSEEPIEDIRPSQTGMSMDYEPKRMADRYRSR